MGAETEAEAEAEAEVGQVGAGAGLGGFRLVFVPAWRITHGLSAR